jgi:hypothetical protein
MVMMVPDPRRFIPGRTLLRVRKVAVRLASTEARHPASSISSSGPGGVRLSPALATRISTGPSALSIRARAASISAKRVRSAIASMPRPPARSISPRTADTAAESRPCTATFAPCSANRRAISAPIPRELPVTHTTFPARSG